MHACSVNYLSYPGIYIHVIAVYLLQTKVVFIPSDIYLKNYRKLIVLNTINFNELSCIYNNFNEGEK